MIVVLKPSGGAGQSFKGLHAYCAHDQDRAQTSERVDWIDTRNLAADDPDQAWRIMAATAYAQNDLKRSAGIRAGQPPKDGAVLHVVLSFDQDEPTDRKSIEATADEFLSQLGVDPAKMRSKTKPKHRQFANEHQSIMYVHSDTEHTHVHLMINRVHPETGRLLPDNNDFEKAQSWALDYSKRTGTDHKTPARSENRDMRKNGEFVTDRRKSRTAFEQDYVIDQAIARSANDNDQVQSFKADQHKKSAALALRGRNMAELHGVAWNKLVDAHKQRKASLGRQLQKQIGKAKSEIRETFRPKWRELRKFQKAELQTFETLEKTLFGRASNIMKTANVSRADIVSGDKSGVISRTFKILTNATARKAYFESAQKRQINSLGREQSKTTNSYIESLKSAQQPKYTANRAVLSVQRIELTQKQIIERQQLKNDWKSFTAERSAAIDQILQRTPKQDKLEAQAAKIIKRLDSMGDFGSASREQSPDQDNNRDHGDDHKR